MKGVRFPLLRHISWLGFFIAVASNIWSASEPVVLTNATASYSQLIPDRYSVDQSIDSDTNRTGWAVQGTGARTKAETAVFETMQDSGYAAGRLLTFTLSTSYVNSDGGQNLGRFRLSVTDADRDTFADGQINGGNLGSDWTVLRPISYVSIAGAQLQRLSDDSLLASGTNALVDTYLVTAACDLSRVTGFRLEALEDPSLPGEGPGRAPDGNFVLMNFAVAIEPLRADLLSAIRVSSVDICWPGRSNQVYQVEYRSELTTNRWVPLASPVLGTGTNCITDVVSGFERRFYRVVDSQ